MIGGTEYEELKIEGSTLEEFLKQYRDRYAWLENRTRESIVAFEIVTA